MISVEPRGERLEEGRRRAGREEKVRHERPGRAARAEQRSGRGRVDERAREIGGGAGAPPKAVEACLHRRKSTNRWYTPTRPAAGAGSESWRGATSTACGGGAAPTTASASAPTSRARAAIVPVGGVRAAASPPYKNFTFYIRREIEVFTSSDVAPRRGVARGRRRSGGPCVMRS